MEQKRAMELAKSIIHEIVEQRRVYDGQTEEEVLANFLGRLSEAPPVEASAAPIIDIEFALRQFAAGCFSGNIADWPQLRPALRWAVEEIDRLRGSAAQGVDLAHFSTLGYVAPKAKPGEARPSSPSPHAGPGAMWDNEAYHEAVKTPPPSPGIPTQAREWDFLFVEGGSKEIPSMVSVADNEQGPPEIGLTKIRVREILTHPPALPETGIREVLKECQTYLLLLQEMSDKITEADCVRLCSAIDTFLSQPAETGVAEQFRFTDWFREFKKENPEVESHQLIARSAWLAALQGPGGSNNG